MLQLFDQLDFRCGGKTPIKQMKVDSLASITNSPLYTIGAILYSELEGSVYFISSGDAVGGWTFKQFGGGSTEETTVTDKVAESISGTATNQKTINTEVKSFTQTYKDSLTKGDVGLQSYPDDPADLPVQTAQNIINTQVQNDLSTKEDSLGNPPTDGFVLVKNTDGTVIWTDPRDINPLKAESVTVSTDGVVLTYDFENKRPDRIPTIIARRDFELKLENMLVGHTFQLILINDTDNNISVKLPPFLSLVNAGDVGQVSRWSLERRTNTINQGVNLSNNLYTSYIWSIIKVHYPHTFDTESGQKTGQDTYQMSIGESGNVSLFNQ